MNSKATRLTKKIIISLLGNFFMGMGVYAFFTSTMGSDPISVFYDGIHVFFDISYGEAANYVNIVGLLLAILFARKYFYIGTLINALTIGQFINLAEKIYGSLITVEPIFPIKLLLVLLGVLLLGFGIALTISVNLGPSFADCLVLRTQEITKKDYGIIRMIFDGIYVAMGFLLGGVIHLGTVVAVVLLGPVIQKLTEMVKKNILEPLKIDYNIKG